ncbi:MotA/TolQ/ExbB proton channel family protein [Gallaecimonas xiamenensis]|uniref:Outer membrane transport energization protein ExbB n=1 Tax=Gallaecimonas xiamenensis 3-C-1 TaxID=745411 RepID=K2J1R2_9GAMM|nr:MotA/TolQ/ExbB proton channel family protein [Gallaecimonas xiamenensis]EKE68742.1 outer membrane transport energization protein ExbB [Gallaecimonas xiamenensis 3-C-1]
MKTVLKSVVLAAGLFVAAQPVMAAAPQAKTLEQLLQQVQKDRLSEGKINKQREQEFLSERADKQALLSQAKRELVAEQARGKKLEAQFGENEKQLAELEEKLTLAVGNMGEMFGVVRQVAGDAQSRFQTSIISAQFPGRDKLMGELAQSKELPELPQLEDLWFALQKEMTASGEIVKFPANVITGTGDREQREVTRVGTFNLMDADQYLVFNGETETVGELSRQPESYMTATVDSYADNASGYSALYVDPSRGTILTLMTQKVTLDERYKQGGTVGYVITAVLGLGLLIVVERLIVLGGMSAAIRKQLKSDTPSDKNPLGRILKVYENNRNVDVETLELKLDEAILKETPRIERGVSVIKVLAAVAPLLGLLGTVTGMIDTFQSITLFGTGDPKIMAGGISTALVTTVLGLVAALPLIFLHSIVYSRSQSLVHLIEEQATGIIAEHAEKESK